MFSQRKSFLHMSVKLLKDLFVQVDPPVIEVLITSKVCGLFSSYPIEQSVVSNHDKGTSLRVKNQTRVYQDLILNRLTNIPRFVICETPSIIETTLMGR